MTEFCIGRRTPGPELLNEIATLTGAQSFTVDNPNQLPRITKSIGIQLRYQYVLGTGLVSSLATVPGGRSGSVKAAQGARIRHLR